MLDAGNTFWSRVPISVDSAGKVIADAMNLLRYDAMALGEADLLLGREVLDQRIADVNFPVLSANVYIPDTEDLYVDPYVLLDVGGRKIGVIGLTGTEYAVPADLSGGLQGTNPETVLTPMPTPSPTPEPGLDRFENQVVGQLEIQSPKVALEKYLPEVTAQTNTVIVLSNVGWELNTKLAELAPEVDLIVSAGPGELIGQPQQINGAAPLLVQGGYFPSPHPGQLVCSLKLGIEPMGNVTVQDAASPMLDDSFADDEAMKQLLDSYLNKQ